jgi:hypothetical protein
VEHSHGDEDGGRSRREYFRVKTHLPVRARPLRAGESGPLEAEIQNRASHAATHVDPELAGWLDRMESKIDQVLAHLGLAEAPFAEADVQEVLLSGAGMRFVAAEGHPVGSDLLLEFELPGRPRRRVRSIARVVSCERVARGSEHALAVSFHVIHEDDRDAVVGHTLGVQRAELRARAEAT